MLKLGKLLLVSSVVSVMNGPMASASSKVWDQSEIVQALDIKAQPNGANWFMTKNGTKCNVAVALTTSSAVNMYASAGDAVATNPDKSAGVKIVSPETKTCLEAAEKLLENLK